MKSALHGYSQKEVDDASKKLVMLIASLQCGKTAVADPARCWEILVKSHEYAVMKDIVERGIADNLPDAEVTP